jgi:hypothetical protein
MPPSIPIHDMPPNEIAELLAAEDGDLTEGQAGAVQEFIEDIGGIENAYQAVDMLKQLEETA